MKINKIKKPAAIITFTMIFLTTFINAGQKTYKNLLKPKHTLSIPNKKYYIDRAGNYIYFGKPIKKGTLEIKYDFENNTYNELNYSIRYFYTERITDDDLFDNLPKDISGMNYKGEIIHDFRYLSKGNTYKSFYHGHIYIPRKFLRLDIKTPEGIKYIISPLLNHEIIYNLDKNQLKKRAGLILASYKKFRSGISDIILHEKIRYSSFAWITLKRSRYNKINRDNIIWHYYTKAILKEQHITGKINKISDYLNKNNIPLNKNALFNFYKQNNYLRFPENSEYYILKFRYNEKIVNIIVPVEKIYHNTLNSPIKEIVTFFARKFLKNNPDAQLLCTKEEKMGKWVFLKLK